MPKKDSGVTKEKTSKIVKKIPASECGIGVLCTTRSGSSTRSAKIQKRRSIRYGILWMVDMRNLRLEIRHMIYTP